MVQPKTERHIVMWYLPIWENQVFYFCLRWSLSGGNPPNPPYVSKLTVQFENTRFRLLSCLGLKLNFAPVPLFHSELWITINLDSLAHFYFTLINESWKKSETQDHHWACFAETTRAQRFIICIWNRALGFSGNRARWWSQRTTYIFAQRGIFVIRHLTWVS